ncbi:MAG TPA: methyltransferase domain-containing protein [Rickettsiales bacterium]|nr:methyltransferase domain-containing protein [Rickettsiales bacterium]
MPSSRHLAGAMASQLATLTKDDYVVELGPGTGVITRALCDSGIDPSKLIVIERDHRFVEQLKHDFPQALILQGDARHVKELLERHNIKQVSSVVCCLPLLAMPDNVRLSIVNAAFEVLKPEGAFILYTYGLISPVSEQNQRLIGIRGQVAKRVWRNFPPARVWRYKVENAYEKH